MLDVTNQENANQNLTPVRMTSGKRVTVGKDLEEEETVCTVDGSVNCTAFINNNMKAPQKIKTRTLLNQQPHFWVYF